MKTKEVEFTKRNSETGAEESAGFIVFREGKVIADGLDADVRKEVLELGARTYDKKGNKVQYFPKDGILFMEALQFAFSGSYFWAGKVNDGRQEGL